MEEVMGGLVNCRLPSGLAPQVASEGKWQGTIQLASPLNLPSKSYFCFLHHKYYSIFLLQQEASALWNTVLVINNNGILVHLS
jgi:hypothetical protein